MDWDKIRTEADAEIATLTSRLENLRTLRRALTGLVGEHKSDGGSASPQIVPPNPPSIAEPKRESATLNQAAAMPNHAMHGTRYERISQILRLTGKPLGIVEIRNKLMALGDGEDKDKNIFYNVIDSALRAGEKKGIYHRAGKGLWSSVPTSRDKTPIRQTGGIGNSITAISVSKKDRPPSYVEAAETFATEKGGPFRLGEVADWLIEQGFKQPDKRPGMLGTLFNALKLSPKFRNNGGSWELIAKADPKSVSRVLLE